MTEMFMAKIQLKSSTVLVGNKSFTVDLKAASKSHPNISHIFGNNRKNSRKITKIGVQLLKLTSLHFVLVCHILYFI